MEVVILGCGTSSSAPSMRCLLGRGCAVCREAQANPDSKNRRLNPSLLLRNLETKTNVLVDCGKTFREAALRIFPKIGVATVHSVVLTHDHADACLGLDDLRAVQPLVETQLGKVPPDVLKVHCCGDTSRDVRAKFPYLMEDCPPHSDAPLEKPLRWTAKLRLEVFEPWQSFEACGVQLLPIPVTHGAGYTSFGFEFGHEFGARFVYISDVSELPEQTRTYLNDAGKPPIDILMIDALYLDKRNSAHMNLMQVVKEVETIRPRRTLLTGMSHELDYFTYGRLVKQLGNEKGLQIEMPYDGMRIAFS
jgi:phosphoribosyl 1,2-cyclic phosphodiesterase